MEPEKWLPVVGFEGWYSVSDHGRIRSEDRTVVYDTGRVRRYRGRILKPFRNKFGHQLVDLTNRRRSVRVHVLVLTAFVGPCPPGMEGCHWDDNPANNMLSNLRWGTRSDNMQDALRNGTHPTGSKTHCKYGHAFTPENTYTKTQGGRECRICIKERKARQWAEKRAAMPPREPQKACRRAGHDWTDPRNFYVTKKGTRVCAECARIRSRQQHEARRTLGRTA